MNKKQESELEHYLAVRRKANAVSDKKKMTPVMETAMAHNESEKIKVEEDTIKVY
jgi:hypothetical protein